MRIRQLKKYEQISISFNAVFFCIPYSSTFSFFSLSFFNSEQSCLAAFRSFPLIKNSVMAPKAVFDFIIEVVNEGCQGRRNRGILEGLPLLVEKGHIPPARTKSVLGH